MNRAWNGPRPDRGALLRAARPHALNQPTGKDWYRVHSFVDQPDRAAVYIYDEIGYWGTTAADFVRELNGLRVTQLDIHINSPGGEVDDGVAIFNAIRAHRAQTTVYIDGLAASAASFIAQAGDRRVIARNAQVMIHDALGLALGNAAEMRAYADLLDRYSDNIADIYAQRGGGTVDEWRERMRAETWYTGAEAVAAGLADEVDGEPDEDDDQDMATDRWDMSLFAFRYPGRAAAPDPPVPAAVTEPVEAEPVEEDTAPAAGAPEAPPEPVQTPEDVEPPALEPDAAPSPAASTNDTDPWAELTDGLLSATPAPSTPDDAFAALKEGLLS